MNDISNNIKKVLFIFLVLFIALISYITYFEIFQAPKIVSYNLNKRVWVKRNEVLRGTILDRNGNPLTTSTRVDELTQKRTYTGGAMFAHVLGYVNEKYGITGLERKYDSDLMADDTSSIFNIVNLNKKKEEKIGRDLKTTLNSDVQKAAYDALGDRKGAVVVLNPKTGEVLAMVSRPSFDPNNLDATWASLNSSTGDRPLLNRAVSGLYPPGSTFKTITAISALDNINNITNRTFQDNGKLVFNSKESLSDFEGEVLGNLSFEEAYVKSSNVAFGTIGLDLGNKNLKNTAESFFFNKTIPSDGFVIDHSVFPTYQSYEKGNIAQSAIGQSGVLASPMQMALVASTIANGGTMMRPYLVSQVLTNKGGVVKTVQPQAIASIISGKDAQTMKDYMRAVVASGTGVAANVPGLNVCGKTGTAEHMENGKQAPAHSWFISFAPYENPQVAVAVIVEDGGQGGGAAANIAAQVISKALGK